MQQLPLPDLNKRALNTNPQPTARPQKPTHARPLPPHPLAGTTPLNPQEIVPEAGSPREQSAAEPLAMTTLDPCGGEAWDTEIQGDRPTSPPVERSPQSNTNTTSHHQGAEITSLIDLLGLGTSIATSVTLGICGYYAHELIDPEVDVALLPDIPTSDESSRLDATRMTSLAEVSGNVAIASPEFFPSLRNETRQWGSDLQRFVRALQTPRATPKLALTQSEMMPQYPANPTIERWLDHTSGVQSDPAGKQQIYLAKTHAMQGQFAAAIVELQKIPATSPHYDLAQTKITEYTQSRDVRAQVSLQVAYDLAAAGDFGGAIAFLNEIPAEASIYTTVQQKRLEYTKKRDVQAQTWLYRAKNLAAAMQYDEAIEMLRVIPQGTSVYGEAKQKVLEYHQTAVQLEQQRLEQQRLEQQRLEQQHLEPDNNREAPTPNPTTTP